MMDMMVMMLSVMVKMVVMIMVKVKLVTLVSTMMLMMIMVVVVMVVMRGVAERLAMAKFMSGPCLHSQVPVGLCLEATTIKLHRAALVWCAF